MDFYKHNELINFMEADPTFQEIYVTKDGFFLKPNNGCKKSSNFEDFKYISCKMFNKCKKFDLDSLLKWCNEHKYVKHHAFIVFTFWNKIKGNVGSIVRDLVANKTLKYLDEIAPRVCPKRMHKMMLPEILKCNESIEKQIIDKLNNVKNEQDMKNIISLFNQHQDTICFTLLKPSLFYFALKMPSKYLLRKCCEKHDDINIYIFEKIIRSGIFQTYTPYVSLFKTLDFSDYDKEIKNIFYEMKNKMLQSLENITFNENNTRDMLKLCQDSINSGKLHCEAIILSYVRDKFENNVHDEINILLRNGFIGKTIKQDVDNVIECIIKNINKGNEIWMSYGEYLNEMSCFKYFKMMNKIENQEYVDRMLKKFMSNKDIHYMMKEIEFGSILSDVGYVGTIVNALCSNDIFIAKVILSWDWDFLDFIATNNSNTFIQNSINVITMMVQVNGKSNVKDFAIKYSELYDDDDYNDECDKEEDVEEEDGSDEVINNGMDENGSNGERNEDNSDIYHHDEIVEVCEKFVKANFYTPKMKNMIVDASVKYDITLFLENYNHCSSEDFDKYNLDSCPNVVGYLISKKIIKQADYVSLIFNNNYHQMLTHMDTHDVETRNNVINNRERYYRAAMDSNSIQLMEWLMKNFLSPDLFTWSDIVSSFTNNNIAMLNTMIECGVGLDSLRRDNNKLFKKAFHEGNYDMFIIFMKNNWRLYELEISEDEIAKICLEKHRYNILKYVIEAGLVVTFKTLEPFMHHLIEKEKEFIVSLYNKQYLSKDNLRPYDNHAFINDIIKDVICGICQELIYADYHICRHCKNRTHNKCINEWIYGQSKNKCIYCRKKIFKKNIINWSINDI